jgi:hypothetical protein
VRNGSQAARPPCFLCSPDPSLVYAREDLFFAMLGWGPIGAGYSIIATVKHEPSMFDLATSDLAELDRFSAAVRERLRTDFGPTIMTEHGRVAPCVAKPIRAYEPHCLHAHRLVFCGHDHLDVHRLAPGYDWATFASIADARAADPGGQYLCCQQADGTVELATVSGPLPRQFFRTVVAAAVGHPGLADWRERRGQGVIESARSVLVGAR